VPGGPGSGQNQAAVQIVSYSDDACTLNPVVGATIQTGTAGCTTQGASTGESRAWYCSSDASTVFAVSFADTACTAAKAYQVSAQSTTCGFSANKQWFKCVNATAGPAPVVTPASAGFASATNCVNATNNYNGASTCAASGSNVKCSTFGFNSGFCQTTGNLVAGSLSKMSGCSPDQTLRGTVYFSDNACQTPVMWTMYDTECADGTVVNSCAQATPALPSKGVIAYGNNDCTDDYYNPTYATFYGDACINNRKFSCDTVNGTLAGTLETFTGANGACTTSVSKVTQEQGVCVNGKVYFCNYTPKNAAAGVQISFVAMIVAALIALVAARS